MIGSASAVEQESSSEQSLAKAKRWLQNCASQHLARNKPVGLHDLPQRFLHIEPSNPRLVLSGIDTTRYIALSYCWGKTQNVTTILKNLDSHMQVGTPREQLPQTYIDLITIAQYMGVKYVWIDALCIIQDSKQDWATEASKMCSVYEQAYLTVSADCSVDTTAGIFSHQSYSLESTSLSYKGITISVRKYTARSHNLIEPLHMLDFRPATSDEPLGKPGSDLPLGKRAWALQEGVLSTRTIHFTGRELVWECNQDYLCECGQTRKPQAGRSNRSLRMPEWFKSSRDSVEIFDQWRGYIEIYTMRNLTFNSDKPVAISALAQKMQAAIRYATGTEPVYLAGLWSLSFAQDLLWGRKFDHDRINRLDILSRQGTCTAPSWSWMSWNGAVVPFYSIGDRTRSGMLGKMFHPNADVLEFRDDITLLDYSYDATTQDSSAAATVISSVRLKGQLAEVSLSSETPKFLATMGGFSAISLANGKSYAIHLDHGYDEAGQSCLKNAEPEESVSEKHYCLRVGSTKIGKFWQPFFLVVKESRRVPNAYERIGISRITLVSDNMVPYFEYFDLFDGVEEVTFDFV